LGFVILFFCIFVTRVEKLAVGAYVAPRFSSKSHFHMTEPVPALSSSTGFSMGAGFS